MDFTLYWFMFPVAVCVATAAMLSGIGGAALFTPIFILVFPLLGPEYPLQSTVAAIGTALLTETFGFTSGFIGYYRRQLIDFKLVRRFLKLSVPIAVAGAFLARYVPDAILIAGYAALVLIIAAVHVFVTDAPHAEHGRTGDISSLTDARGQTYRYVIPKLTARDSLATGIGSFMTGMLSVGIGEVIVPQLTKRGVPVGIAVAAAVTIVIVTVACASFTLIGQVVAEGGWSAVPWNLVCYSIPGVLIGGQIGPMLQGRFSQRRMEQAIAVLFILLAGAMLLVALQKAGLSSNRP
ncbi:MAG: sulfite exporter TauE/SafE family protein [Pseudomonadota bacterium]